MTTLDRLLKEHVEELLKEARPEQLQKLLAEIGLTDRDPNPNHNGTEKLQ